MRKVAVETESQTKGKGSMIDKDKIEALKSIKIAKYKNIGLDHLVMYSVAQLEKIGADLSVENAVVACFKLFPNKFSLPGFSLYPDSARVKSCLTRCTHKTKQWLGGKTRQGFIITDRARTIITEAENMLSGRLQKEIKVASQTRRKESILAEVRTSPAYLKYRNGQGSSISESDFCFLLQGTLDSSREILSGNLEALQRFAEELQHEDVLQFVTWLKQHFKNFFDNRNS